jgi:hypothetical protein
MSVQIYSNLDYVKKHQVSALKKAADEIGIDCHDMMFTGYTKSGAKVINEKMNDIFKESQECIYGYKRFQILTSVSAGLKHSDLEKYIESTEKGKIHIYQDVSKLPNGETSMNSLAKIILKDLQCAYNQGLNVGWYSKDTEIKKISQYLIYDDIIKVPGLLVPDKSKQISTFGY